MWVDVDKRLGKIGRGGGRGEYIAARAVMTPSVGNDSRDNVHLSYLGAWGKASYESGTKPGRSN